MAKSLRSKPKLRAKSVKRNGEFQKFVDGRNERLAAKMEAHTRQQAEEKAAKQAAAGDAGDAGDAAEMETDAKKVSTSGWRQSRGQIYKQRKIKGSKKSKTMKF